MVFNEKLHVKIEDVERDLDNWRKSIKILLSGKSDMVSTTFRCQKRTIDENVKKKLESRYSAYKYFIEVQRDGVQYELTKKALPVVEVATLMIYLYVS